MLKPAKTLPVQNWMTAPETAAVMGALNKGGAGQALFVGGCVRNMLLGEEVGDIDIATVHTPQDVEAMLTAAGIKVVPTGIDHGTVTAVSGGKPFEITTLRKDVETDGRRAVVAFTDKWEEDAQRRDFTMNTLLADAQGNIYDPTGQGLRDLEARCVVFVGDPAQRIAEDYLRILRFFRFHAFYGRGAPDGAALKACRAAADKISTLSKERITQEFFKILSCDDPAGVLALMFENGVLKAFCFPEYRSDFLRHVARFQKDYRLSLVPARLYILAGMRQENLGTMAELLLIPKLFKKDIEAISKVLALPPLDNDHAVRVAVYKCGRTAAAQALMIALAQDKVVNNYAPKALKIIQEWEIPDFPVSGDDLQKAGIKPGPAMGKKLHEIEEWWIGRDFIPDREECLKQLI